MTRKKTNVAALADDRTYRMLENQPPFDLRVGHAGTLHQAMDEVYKAVCTAHDAYESTLRRYVDCPITTEGGIVISQEVQL